MSVKRVQRGTTSGPLVTLTVAGGVLPAASAAVSAALPLVHAGHPVYGTHSMPGFAAFVGAGGAGLQSDAASPPPLAYYGNSPQHRGVYGATGPLMAVGAGGGGAAQRALFRSTMGGAGAGGGAAGTASAGCVNGAVSHAGSGGDSPRCQAGMPAAADGAGGPGLSAVQCGHSSQPLYILGYGSNGNGVSDGGASWEYGGRPGGLVGWTPALMAPTEEGHETEAEAEDEDEGDL